MTTPTPLMPREQVPALTLPTVAGSDYVLGQEPGERFDLLVFYRGAHCPICKKYLKDLESLAPEFEKRGVRCIAISADDEARAKSMAETFEAKLVTVAHDLPLASARAWGLYLSKGKEGEPDIFSEPGVFLVRPDMTLYYGSTQTMPFARPSFSDLLGAVDFSINKNYPARGEYKDTV